MPILLVTSGVALATLAIVPFLRATLAISRSGSTTALGPGERLRSVFWMLTRMVDHPSLAVHRPIEGAAVVSAAVLIVVAVRASRWPGLAIGLSLALGVVAVAGARLMVGSFDAATLNYNAWMRPGLCVLLASGPAARSRVTRRTAAVAAGVLVLAQACATYQVLARGEHFAHGPHRPIASLIREGGTDGLAVVHDDATDHLVFIYCPIRYEFGPGLAQYRLAGESGGRVLVRRFPGGVETVPLESLPFGRLLVIRSKGTTPKALVHQLRKGDRPFGVGPTVKQLRSSTEWREVRDELVVALDAAQIDLFERVRR